MSRTDTWMPLFIGDYTADTMRLTTLEHGAYLLLLMDYWRQGPLPDDDHELAAIARVDRKVWDNGIGRSIRRYFQLHDDGLLHQKRADAERGRALEISEKRRTAVSQRADRTAYKPSTIEPTNDLQLNTHARVAVQSQSQIQKKEPSLRSGQTRKSSEANGTRLPDNWNPGSEGATFAKDLGLHPETTFARFADYWRAQPGSKGRKADWPATWRNWCRKEGDDRGTAPRQPNNREPIGVSGALF